MSAVEASLQSITIRFDPLEDRLALRLAVMVQGQEDAIVLHLTRRLAREWRSQLQRAAEHSAQAPEHLGATSRSWVQAAHHQAMAEQVPMQNGPPLPSPELVPPRLLTGISMGRKRDNGAWVLQFVPREGAPLTLTLSDPTLHAVLALLNRQVAQAAWDLPALAVETKAEATAAASVLHDFH